MQIEKDDSWVMVSIPHGWAMSNYATHHGENTIQTPIAESMDGVHIIWFLLSCKLRKMWVEPRNVYHKVIQLNNTQYRRQQYYNPVNNHCRP